MLKTLLLYILFISVTAYSQEKNQQQQTNQPSANTGPKLFGEFALTTNYIDEGISNSNNSFAMQPQIGYMWTHAAIGIFASNVQFPTNSESLNMRPYTWYDIVFEQNVDLKARFDLNMYFKSANRNGNIYRLDMNLWTHHAILEQNTNWFGTNTASLWLAYYREWKIIWNIDYKLECGYQMVNANGYSGYFAIKTGGGYKVSDLYLDLLMNYNSGSSQFPNQIADLGFLLQLTARF